MNKIISNIVFTKNRPLQLEAYLESLYQYFPSNLIQTYIIYKVELFSEEYEQLFNRFRECVIIRESNFHTDLMQILTQVNTEYILFGIDDVVFFDSVNFEIIESTFKEQCDNIFGFTLRFSPKSLTNSGDDIEKIAISGESVYRLNWTKGQTKHTRYPFELCCTFYTTDLIRKIIYNSMKSSSISKSLFMPDSFLIKLLDKLGKKRSTLKHFGYFFSPNTLESWPCRWCQNNSERLPGYTYFQQICATAIQVNMVNTSTNNTCDGTDEHTVEALNEKYKQGYMLDIGYVAENKPTEPGCGQEYFKLIK